MRLTTRNMAQYQAQVAFELNDTLPEVFKQCVGVLSNREIKVILKRYLRSQGE